MNEPSDPSKKWDSLREKVIGLGERSLRKTYYPELQQKLIELERFRALLDQSSEGIILIKMDSQTLVDANLPACRHLNFSRETIINKQVSDLISHEVFRLLGTHLQTIKPEPHHEITFGIPLDPTGSSPRFLEINLRLLSFEQALYALILIRDVTDQKAAEAANRKLEDELFQARKMDSLGRLAGGVAHDFNNLLTVITGHVSLALYQIKPDHFLFESLKEINKAAESSASLTRQLLTFSRRQVAELKIIDLREIISGLEKMLRRLIGENIKLRTCLDDNACLVKVDPGQVEQILVNLSVNARDAMPDGGTLDLRTFPTVIGSEGGIRQDVLKPGPYIILEIRDSGVGMSPEVLQHLFEPFFTTKPKGKGTGLGLATVYSIVKKNNGWIEVASQPGSGTIFKVYFPQLFSREEHSEDDHHQVENSRGSESIMVVEDDKMVRDLVVKQLQGLGYNVIACESGKEALEKFETESFHVDLLLTDVIMPGLNGRALADLLRKKDPKLKVLFSSGYTSDFISQHGIVEGEVNFISKPYLQKTLSRKIRSILDT